ncbi:uncharacterized protein N7500_007906 [Penicillium coprophilum]|uniref:uncharacterized protein n=1 Tax=Penicillium coprophilum TaxID=36646 RepID=UPI00239837D8|nr:uncharacterized protein N7500_007906 [Penicillium coprophilum]KAJ5158255.1 hypothetical protein N7500_007906 [Penicillium coprophilum]
MKPDTAFFLIGAALLGLANAQIKPGPRPASPASPATGGIKPGSGGGIQPGSGGIQPGSGGGIQPGSGGGIKPGSGSIQPGTGGGIQPGSGGGIKPGSGSIQPGTGGGIQPGSGGGTTPGSWTCPNPRKPYNQSPAVTTSISCPASDGSIYETVDGSWYYLQCCTQGSANALSVGTPQVSSMEECLEKCADVANCETVSFEPSTLYCNLLDFGSFSPTPHGSQLHAFPTSPPATKQPTMTTRRCATTCPEGNGQIYVSPFGETFYMSCGMRHGTPYLNVESVSSLEDCMDHCAGSPSCSSVDFDQNKRVCYLSNNDSPPTITAPRFAAAHSVGCSGACEGCGKKSCGAPQPKSDPNQCVDNQIVHVGNHPFRTKCNQCYVGQTALSVSRPEAKTYEQCMQLYLLEANNYVGAHWLKNGGCRLKPAGSAVSDHVNCAAAFVPLWK